MKHLKFNNLFKTIQLISFIFCICAFTNTTAQADDGPIKTGQDLAYVLNALTAPNVLPVFFKRVLPKSEHRQYGAVTFNSVYDDYHPALELGYTPETLSSAIETTANINIFSNQAFSTLQYKFFDGRHYYTIQLKSDDTSSKFTFVLAPVKHNHAYFEKQNAKYNQKLLWAIGASAAWARNPLDNGQALNGQDVTLGVIDFGLRMNHDFGERYIGGYDYINKLPLGPETSQHIANRTCSPIWSQNITTHGDAVTSVAAGSQGLAFGSNVTAARVIGSQFQLFKKESGKLVDTKKTIKDSQFTMAASRFGIKSDTPIYQYIKESNGAYQLRAMDMLESQEDYPDVQQQFIDANSRVVNISLATSGTAPYMHQNAGPGLRGMIGGFPMVSLVGGLTDKGIAVVAIAGNNFSDKGPSDFGALACDHAGFNNSMLCVGAYTEKTAKEQRYFVPGKGMEKQCWLGKSNWAGPCKAMQQRYIVAPSVSGATSSAAPLVSAAYAILFQLDPTLTAKEATEILCLTARDLKNPLRYGCGLLDVDAATRYVIDQRLRQKVTESPLKARKYLPAELEIRQPADKPKAAKSVVRPRAAVAPVVRKRTQFPALKVSLKESDFSNLILAVDRFIYDSNIRYRFEIIAGNASYLVQLNDSKEKFKPFHEAILGKKPKDIRMVLYSPHIIRTAIQSALASGDITIRADENGLFVLGLKNNKSLSFKCSLTQGYPLHITDEDHMSLSRAISSSKQTKVMLSGIHYAFEWFGVPPKTINKDSEYIIKKFGLDSDNSCLYNVTIISGGQSQGTCMIKIKRLDYKDFKYIAPRSNHNLVGQFDSFHYWFTKDPRIGDGRCGFRSFDMNLERALAPWMSGYSKNAFIKEIKDNLANPEVVRLCAPDVRRYKDVADDAVITAEDVRLYLDDFYIRQDEWLRTPSNRIPGTMDINHDETGCPDALALIRNFNYIVWQSDNAGGLTPNHLNLNQKNTRLPLLHILNNDAASGGCHYDCLHLDGVIEIPHENPDIYMPAATKDGRTQTASNLLEGLLHSLNLNENVAVKVNNLTYSLSTRDYDNALHERPEIEALKLDDEGVRKQLIEQGIIRLHQEEESPGSILLRFEFLMGEQIVNQSFRIKDCNPKFGIVDRDQAYRQLAEFVLCILGKENLFEAKDIDLTVVNRYQLAHEDTADEFPVFESSETILPYLLSGDIRIEETSENPMNDISNMRLTVNIGGPVFIHQFICQRLKSQDMSFAGLSTVKNRKAVAALVKAVLLKKTDITIEAAKYAIAHNDVPESQEFFENALVEVIVEALNSDKQKKNDLNLAKCIRKRQIRVESYATGDNTMLCTLYIRHDSFNTEYTFNLQKL